MFRIAECVQTGNEDLKPMDVLLSVMFYADIVVNFVTEKEVQ